MFRFPPSSRLRHLVMPALLLPALLAGTAARADNGVRFSAPQAYPEGIAWSPAEKTIFVSSIHRGHIGKVNRAGHYEPFIRDPRLVSSAGLLLDPARGLLWVAVGDLGNSVRSSAGTQGRLAAVAAYDVITGERRAYHDLGSLTGGSHFANDLALDAHGNLYVTDSFSPVIYQVATDGRASVFVRSPLFEGEGFNLNGIAHHPDGYLLVAKHNSGELFRVQTTGAREIHRVTLPEALRGADGLLLRGQNRLTVVQNAGADRVVELVSDDGWHSAHVASSARSRWSFPTTATLDGDDLYVLNARLDRLLTKGAEPVSEYLLQRF